MPPTKGWTPPDLCGWASSYLEQHVVGENNLFVLLYFLLCILLCDELHATGVAGLQLWLIRIPFPIILVFDAVRFNFKSDDTRKTSLSISMIEDGEMEVIVQEHPPICLKHILSLLVIKKRRKGYSLIGAGAHGLEAIFERVFCAQSITFRFFGSQLQGLFNLSPQGSKDSHGPCSGTQ